MDQSDADNYIKVFIPKLGQYRIRRKPFPALCEWIRRFLFLPDSCQQEQKKYVSNYSNDCTKRCVTEINSKINMLKKKTTILIYKYSAVVRGFLKSRFLLFWIYNGREKNCIKEAVKRVPVSGFMHELQLCCMWRSGEKFSG